MEAHWRVSLLPIKVWHTTACSFFLNVRPSCRYGNFASRGHGPKDGQEVVPWLRETARIGRVELYLITHDPAERVDLSVAYPHVVTVLLTQMMRLLRETAREGPDVSGWTQQAPPCPRLIKKLNVTEYCCHSRQEAWGEDENPI
jgi:hypothetical protein